MSYNIVTCKTGVIDVNIRLSEDGAVRLLGLLTGQDFDGSDEVARLYDELQDIVGPTDEDAWHPDDDDDPLYELAHDFPGGGGQDVPWNTGTKVGTYHVFVAPSKAAECNTYQIAGHLRKYVAQEFGMIKEEVKVVRS